MGLSGSKNQQRNSHQYGDDQQIATASIARQRRFSDLRRLGGLDNNATRGASGRLIGYWRATLSAFRHSHWLNSVVVVIGLYAR